MAVAAWFRRFVSILLVVRIATLGLVWTDNLLSGDASQATPVALHDHP